MTQPDRNAFQTDGSANATESKQNTAGGFLNRIPRPLLYGSVAAGLIGGIAAWYLVFGNQTTEPVAETPTLTQTPNQTDPSITPVTTDPANTSPTTADPNLSRALEVQDIPFLVTAESSNGTGNSTSNTEVAPANGNGSSTTAGLNPFAPIPTPPVQVNQVPTPPVQQPNPNVASANSGIQVPPTLRPTPRPTPAPSTNAPVVTVKRPTPLPTPKTTVQKPPQLNNNSNKPSIAASSKPNPNVAATNPKPKAPIAQAPKAPQAPVIIKSRPDIRLPDSTSTTASLPIAVGGGVLPVVPQIIQKVNPPQVPQIPIVQPQVTPVKPIELPNEGAVITPDATPDQTGLKPSTGNISSPGQVDPLNTTIIPVKPQTPVVVTPPVTTPETQPVRSILNEFVSERQLRYLDYVGGPFPQARLEIKGKSVIIGLGETIPDSKVVVKSITASEMVLLLGEETLTIPRTEK
jgi:hypothetical protein